jgi:hypothetical protein
MDTDVDIAESIPANGIHRTDRSTFATLNADVRFYNHSTTTPVDKGPGGTDLGAGSGIASQTPVGDKAGGKTSRGMNTNPRVEYSLKPSPSQIKKKEFFLLFPAYAAKEP